MRGVEFHQLRPGICSASHRPCSGGVAGSCRPVTTNVGHATRDGEGPQIGVSQRRATADVAVGIGSRNRRAKSGDHFRTSGAELWRKPSHHRRVGNARMPSVRAVWIREDHISRSPIFAAVLARTIRRTRSGACSATHSAVMPPIDTPQRSTRAADVASMIASRSFPRRSIEYSPCRHV